MSNKNKNKKNSKKQQKQSKAPGPQPGRRRAQRVRLSPLAALIANPAAGALTPVRMADGNHGYQLRVRKSSGSGNVFHALDAPVTSISGYVVWFPTYHCGHYDGNGRGLSAFGWLTTNSAAQPRNDAVVSFGGSSNVTTYSIRDPAYDWVSGSNVRDAATLAACIEMSYTGTTSDASGEIALLHDVSMTNLVFGDSGAPVSVDDLFNSSTDIRRLPLGKSRVNFAPNERDSIFHAEGSPTTNQFGDKPLTSGVTPGSAAYTNQRADLMRGFGIAFRNVQQPSSVTPDVFRFTLSKVIEWRPTPTAGVPAVVDSSPASATLDGAVRSLDRLAPSWRGPRDPDAIALRAVSNTALGGAHMAVRPMFDIGLDGFGEHFGLHVG